MIYRIILGAIGGAFLNLSHWALILSNEQLSMNYWRVMKSEHIVLGEILAFGTNMPLLIFTTCLGALAGYCWHMLVKDKEAS